MERRGKEEDDEDFYLRFHVGQKKDHHNRPRHAAEEALEFELLPDGKLRYSNCTATTAHQNYHDSIEREFYVSQSIVEEIKRMVREAAIVNFDDSHWPPPFCNGGGIQEIEIKIDQHHVSFATTEIIGAATTTNSSTSSGDTQKLSPKNQSDDGGLAAFYRFGYDLRSLIMTLISCHFKQRPFAT
jgi:protein mago nashi